MRRICGKRQALKPKFEVGDHDDLGVILTGNPFTSSLGFETDDRPGLFDELLFAGVPPQSDDENSQSRAEQRRRLGDHRQDFGNSIHLIGVGRGVDASDSSRFDPIMNRGSGHDADFSPDLGEIAITVARRPQSEISPCNRIVNRSDPVGTRPDKNAAVRLARKILRRLGQQASGTAPKTIGGVVGGTRHFGYSIIQINTRNRSGPDVINRIDRAG